MALPRLTADVNAISNLPDNIRGSGLTASQIKAAFDEDVGEIKSFLNDTLIPVLETLGLVVAGEYDAEENNEFAQYSLVTYQGSLYVTLQDVSEVTPTNDGENYALLMPGIESIERTVGDGSAGTTDTYTITLANDSTFTFDVTNGADGATGNGIASITRTSGDGSAGSTDTYTITFTDETTTTFDVVNGTDGAGVPDGGTTGQVLVKASNDNQDTEWGDAYVPATVSQADAEVGTSTTVYSWTPERVAQAIAALAGGATITQTQYTGTGTYGTGNKNTINFVAAKFIIIFGDSRIGVLGNPSTAGISFIAGGSGYLVAAWSSDHVDYHHLTDAAVQLNKSGSTYTVYICN